MAAAPKPFLTPEEYLEIERGADAKSEYLSGQMFAMAGASFAHNVVVRNTVVALQNRLRGGSCQAVASDQRVQIAATHLYTYPDVVVICGPPEFTDDRLDTLTNPTVIVEVLSPSTELYDRNEKFRHYETLASLTDYILVAQTCVQVDHFARQREHQWLLSRFQAMQDIVLLPSLDVELPVASLYENVDF
jgi:Uma2 family endonuclease